MSQFVLATGHATVACDTRLPRKAGLLLDVAMTAVMLGLVSVYVATLAISMS